jgi:hypothetical protein|tara:strand:- start:20 stop:1006 length:987 start_codon:yes stop_codon:yes gene_type:complete
MRLRQLFEAPSKVAVIGYGRMNPPTIGHSVLVNAINAKAKKYGGNPMLFLSMTHLAKGSEKSYLTPTGKTNKHFQTAGIKNPLDWKTKLGYAQKFFDIPISTDPSLNTIMSVMKHLENKGYEKVVLVCGSDRVREFETQILPYNNTADQSGNINFNIKEVTVEEGGFRDEEANDASGMSASKMRDAAAQDDFETFKQGVPDQSVAQQMFDDVRRGLGFEHQQEEVKEGDLVLNKASLVPHIKNVIMDYLDQEDDVEKLSRILKMMVGKEVHAHGKRYRIESADITEAFNNIQTEVAGPKKCWPKFKKAGTQAGTGKNKGKRVNKCVPK